MSEKKINLEEIIGKYCYTCMDGSTDIHSSISDVKELLLTFAEQLLALAAENAKINLIKHPGFERDIYNGVNKQSILDTIKQVE